MLRSSFVFAALAAALAFGPAAQTQAQMPAPAAPAPSHPAYGQQQLDAFARATVDIQALGSQDPDAMTRSIQANGLSVEQYNEMGDAMRGDPALAASLDPFLQHARVERVASDAAAGRYQPHPGAAATSSRASRTRAASSHVSSGKASRHGKRHATSAHRSASSRHHVGKTSRTTGHHATARHSASRHAATHTTHKPATRRHRKS
ncbi:hypothetical protein DJ021_08055 [Phenylobacterium hankyongense]|uniref:DUF4168 domain-containing protein n=1 Tax=Phenylobacterium hankyongense TaxID=1813876 RepID=A0A328B424_9CAUL|nr:DUF4168 domain-containing protein [Phenylobacterium hankyongense]RAK59758.1 hypothetical protein DJ021_08055 [Phenylobacterium hankyongense]